MIKNGSISGKHKHSSKSHSILMTYSNICVIYPATESEIWEPFDASTRCSLGLQLLHCMAILKVHEVSKIQRLSLSPARVKLPWYSLMFGHLANLGVSCLINHCNWCFPCMWFRHRIIQLDLIIDPKASQGGGNQAVARRSPIDSSQSQFFSASWDHHPKGRIGIWKNATRNT